jgi:ATP-dependent Lon protease
VISSILLYNHFQRVICEKIFKHTLFIPRNYIYKKPKAILKAKNMENKTFDTFPVLPLRDIVVFPDMVIPLFVGRDKSIKALNSVGADGTMVVVAQKQSDLDDPKTKDLYKVGVKIKILQVLKLQEPTVKVLIEGVERVKITRYEVSEGFIQATVKPFEDDELKPKQEEEVKALRETTLDQFEEYVKMNPKIPFDVIHTLTKINDPARFTNLVTSHLMVDVVRKQELLQEAKVTKRFHSILSLIAGEIDLLKLKSKISKRVETQVAKNQKDYFLNEQLKAIQKELGEEDFKDEINELAEKLHKLKLTTEAREKVDSEVRKLKSMNPASSETSVIRSYLDWILELPWKTYSKTTKNLQKGLETLDAEHYGLEKVKERILEYIAVNIKTNKINGPILCLVGPPGVGKTSLARSIANATGRKFVKVALGGMRDVAEIKGHRRTYIGALPGRILQAMKKAKTNNPVILLDEIDKMGADFHGDPSSALLEVLDPEQNKNFNDHYLELDYDLSKVMFVTTANSMDIPAPLADRMEIISLSGYTEREKTEIAKRHLLPKELEAHGTSEEEVKISEEAIRDLIRYYTREAGVRGLDQRIAKLIRKAIKNSMLKQSEEKGAKAKASAKKAKEKAAPIEITAESLHDYLGVRRYRNTDIEDRDLVGVTNGLAYTSVGGDILPIEALTMHGKGDYKVTGKLGDVMKESMQAAMSYIKARAHDFGIDVRKLRKMDIHIHVPDGATPKDGPSAGVTICTSIVSVLTGIKVRRDVAMTGEISLRGRVLPIGGLKEKLLSAMRAGIKIAMIPEDNRKDLEEVPQEVKDALEIVPVSYLDEVLEIALTEKPEATEWLDWDAVPDDGISRIGASDADNKRPN